MSAPDRSTLLRAAAARAVLEVTDKGHTLESAVAMAARDLHAGDRAALQAIAFGTLRSLLRLQPAIASLANRDWSKTAAPVRALLLTGVFELEDAATPPHAVVTSTVEAVRVLGQPKALFPYDQPALFSMPVAFLFSFGVSWLDARSARSRAERAAFDDQFVRAQTGYGAAAASQH